MPIKVENLSYTYDPKAPFRKDALKNVSLTIEDGDFFGIIGRTGSGKSTLVTHFNGLIEVQSGKITVDDIELSAKSKYDKKKLRAKVGMVFQYPEYQLFADTVRDDVAFGPKNLGLKSDEIDERVKNSITMVGLNYDEIKDRSPFELSGGQMRRVALAGIIAMKPEILVLDEPTAGLDPQGKENIMRLIKSLKETIKTVVIISHNMDEVAANCNKIAVMDDGRVKGVFTPGQLFSGSTADEMGVELPSVTKFARMLSARGLNVGDDITDENQLIRAIKRAKGVTG